MQPGMRQPMMPVQQEQLHNVYREILPPNTIEHAVWADVLGPGSESLVVARPNSLSVYSLKQSIQEVRDNFRRCAQGVVLTRLIRSLHG